MDDMPARYQHYIEGEKKVISLIRNRLKRLHGVVSAVEVNGWLDDIDLTTISENEIDKKDKADADLVAQSRRPKIVDSLLDMAKDYAVDSVDAETLVEAADALVVESNNIMLKVRWPKDAETVRLSWKLKNGMSWLDELIRPDA